MKSKWWICLVILLVMPISSFSKGIDIRNQGNNITTISTDSGMEYTLNSTSCSFISMNNSKVNNYNVINTPGNGIFLDYNISYVFIFTNKGGRVNSCSLVINSSQMVNIVGYMDNLKREYIIYNNNPWMQVFDNVTASVTQRSLFDYMMNNNCNISFGDGTSNGNEYEGNWINYNITEGWLTSQKVGEADTDSLFYIFDELENGGNASKNMIESDEASQCRMQRYSADVDDDYRINGWQNTTYRVGISYYNPYLTRTLWNETYFSNRTTVSIISPTSYKKVQADYINMSGNGTFCAGNVRINSGYYRNKTILLECGNFSSGTTNLYFYSKNVSSDTTNYAVSDIGVSDLSGHYYYNTTDWVYGSKDPLGRTGIIGNETSICGDTKVCTYGNMKSNTGSISVFMPLDNFNVTNTKFVMLTDYILETLRITAYDEKTYANLTFNITISNLTDSVSSTLQQSYNESWENLPLGNVDIYITADGYVQRKFTTTINEDSHLVIRAYLLKTSDGSFTRFHIEDQAGSVIQNVDVTIYKYIDFQWQIVETAESDDSGVATTFLDPLTTYTVEFTKSGYTSANYSIQPSSSDYTITMTSVSLYTPAVEQLTNITYSIKPQSNVTATNVVFSFTINSFDSKLEWWAFDVRYNGTSYFFSNETTASGGINSTTLNLGNGTFNPNATIITYAYFKKQNVTTPFRINTSYYIWKVEIPSNTSVVGIANWMKGELDLEGSDSYNKFWIGFGVIGIALIAGGVVGGDGGGFVSLGIIGIGLFIGLLSFFPTGMGISTPIIFGVLCMAYLAYVFMRGGI